MNILESIELVKSCTKESNEAAAEIWKHFVGIKTSSAWQKEEYYEGADSFKRLVKGTFENFLRNAFGYTLIWFNRMDQIFRLRMGAHLFVKYGYSNMVTYLNSSPSERTAILTAAEKSPKTVAFSAIRRRLFPAARKVALPKYKTQYEAAKKENTTLKAENDTLKAQLDALQEKYDADVRKLLLAVRVLHVTSKKAAKAV